MTLNTESHTLWFFNLASQIDEGGKYVLGTSPKNLSSVGVTGGSFTLIGSVGSWQSKFKVVTFCNYSIAILCHLTKN